MPMMPLIDITGLRFGRLAVLCRDETVKGRAPSQWVVRCDCGTEKSVRSEALRSGRTQSCGCLGRERLTERPRRLTHGEAAQPTPEYVAWRSMITRCENPNAAKWPHYGGRGVTVCERWRKDFGAFLADVGRRPSDSHSLDRIDVNGSYEPGNVRWADAITQRHNRRDSDRRTA